MVRNLNIALQALHEVLIAARNIGTEDPKTPALLAIVDSVEMLPIWMAAPDIDRTAEIIRVLN